MLTSTIHARLAPMRSSNSETMTVREDEPTRVLRWRRTEFVRGGGFASIAAIGLAVQFEIDLHEALKLVPNGCPPTSALRIL